MVEAQAILEGKRHNRKRARLGTDEEGDGGAV